MARLVCVIRLVVLVIFDESLARGIRVSSFFVGVGWSSAVIP